VVRNHEANRLHFTTDLPSVLNDMDMVFIAVGTPSEDDGTADLSQVMTVAQTIADHMTTPLLIVTKSTVPVGTSFKVRDLIRKRLDERGMNDLTFDVPLTPSS